MKQTSTLTQALTDAQVNAASAKGIAFALYTEKRDNLASIVAKYFDGATLYNGVGLWQGDTEYSTVIEIIGSRADANKIQALANEIRTTNYQQAVLVTARKLNAVIVS